MYMYIYIEIMVHLCGVVWFYNRIIRTTIVAISIEIQLDKKYYSGWRRSEKKQKIGIVESLIGA